MRLKADVKSDQKGICEAFVVPTRESLIRWWIGTARKRDENSWTRLIRVWENTERKTQALTNQNLIDILILRWAPTRMLRMRGIQEKGCCTRWRGRSWGLIGHLLCGRRVWALMGWVDHRDGNL